MKNFFRLRVIIGALPVTLTNGTTADATQVMSDLNWIINQVNSNAAPLANTALVNANNNFTVAQSGTAASAPANFPIASQVQNESFNTLSSIMGTNTVTGRIAQLTLTAYSVGQVFRWIPSQRNTAAATISVDGVGTKNLLNFGSTLSGGELRPLIPMQGYYDNISDAVHLMGGTPFVQGPNVPAAATLNLDAVEGDYNQIDGTTAITAITLSRGRMKWLEFTSSPVLTSGASLIIGGVNQTPNPGDSMVVRGEAAGVVRMMNWHRASSAKQPTRQVLTSGTGATYTRPAGATRIDVRVQGASSGGGSNTTSTQAAASTFVGAGVSLTANGGAASVAAGGTPATAATASGGDVNISGAVGTVCVNSAVTNSGASGASSPFGGAGGGGAGSGGPSSGSAAAPNSGSGGGGGGASGAPAGSGGNAGAYLEKRITNPNPTYTYTVGAKSVGGTSSASVAPGGDGADGIIIVDEYYD